MFAQLVFGGEAFRAQVAFKRLADAVRDSFVISQTTFTFARLVAIAAHM